MKILFDENFPRSLNKHFYKIHTVFTVQEMRWSGKKNGELVQLLLSNDFEVLLTADKNFHIQQNIAKFPIIFILIDIKTVRPDTLEPYMVTVLKLLANNPRNGLFKIP